MTFFIIIINFQKCLYFFFFAVGFYVVLAAQEGKSSFTLAMFHWDVNESQNNQKN